jgi:hypothetical protein
MDKVFIEGSLKTKFLVGGTRHATDPKYPQIDAILRPFRISDKPDWTHTSDAVGPIKVALQPRQLPWQALDWVRRLQHDSAQWSAHRTSTKANTY